MTERYYGNNHKFTSRNADTDITIESGVGETLYVNGVQDSASLTATRTMSGFTKDAYSGTTIAVINTFYPMSGATTVDTHNYNFTHATNKLTYTGTRSGVFIVSYNASVIGSASDVLEFAISVNDVIIPSSRSKCTMTTAPARLSAIGNTCHISMNTGDYVIFNVNNNSTLGTINVGVMNLSLFGVF